MIAFCYYEILFLSLFCWFITFKGWTESFEIDFNMHKVIESKVELIKYLFPGKSPKKIRVLFVGLLYIWKKKYVWISQWLVFISAFTANRFNLSNLLAAWPYHSFWIFMGQMNRLLRMITTLASYFPWFDSFVTTSTFLNTSSFKAFIIYLFVIDCVIGSS